MSEGKSIRSLSFDKAKDEDLQYSLSLTHKQRIKRLEELRILNIGKKASQNISHTIVLIK